jgi:hypothetical protein
MQVLASPCFAGSTYDIVRSFSATKNPRFPFSYLGNGYLLTNSIDPANGEAGWVSNGNSQYGYYSYVVGNFTKSTISSGTIILPSGYVNLDPESGFSTITWTAPVSGTYTIAGDFLGIDTNEGSHVVQINAGSSGTAFGANISSYGQDAPFSFSVALNKGQIVSFTVQTGSDYHNLSTGLRGTISLSQ